MKAIIFVISVCYIAICFFILFHIKILNIIFGPIRGKPKTLLLTALLINVKVIITRLQRLP